MRVLFVTWAWPSHFLPLVQLAWACRAAGHEVLVASQPSLEGEAVGAGLPFAAVGRDLDIRPLVRPFFSRLVDENRTVEWAEMRRWGTANVHTYVLLAEAMAEDTTALARHWRPDLVVCEPTTYAGPLAAAAVGVPAVRQLWGADYTYRTREFEPDALRELAARLGLTEDVETLGVASVDPCPPSLQTDAPVRRIPLRYAPFHGTGSLPGAPAGSGRPRILVTGSSAVAELSGRDVPDLPVLLRALGTLDADVVAVVPERERARLRTLPGGLPDTVRLVGRTPLHLLLHGSDLLVHQGGGGSVLAGAAAGVPQLVAPRFPDHLFNARQLAATGAGLLLAPGALRPDAVREAAAALLSGPDHRAAAQGLRHEIEAMPPAAAAVAGLERVAHDPGRGPSMTSTTGELP
ncbi:nucleotide disphospho-sugar-binding domain-containing protein [Streptomyces sp. NPDC001404]|uniref:nucleotide disphospho-sugar-binding domain-containing protein n=1 Tax=Streptomyces sp. NPDC001404 TaxID=3364571 RepID=UPI0036AB9CD5